jgi:hypothetical protein
MKAPLLAAALLVFPAYVTSAQWAEQSISLRPGWNAIHLEVDPATPQCVEVFKSLPVESVWQWERRFNPQQFIQDPDDLLPGEPDWTTYFPADHPQAFLTDLTELRGGRSYLVKLRDGAPGATLTLTGTPVLPRIEWIPDGYTLVGFHVDPGNPPTFADYLQSSAAHDAAKVYRLDEQGQWQTIGDPRGVQIKPGEAYWVHCDGASRFTGPLQVQLDYGAALDFAEDATERSLSVRSLWPTRTTVALKTVMPAAPPAGVEYGGTAPLARWDGGSEERNAGWVPLSENYSLGGLNAGGQEDLRLMVRRSGMARNTAWRRARYGEILEIRDGRGSLIRVPVMARQAPTHARNATFAVPDTMRTGLWIGLASVTAVSQPAFASNRENPVPTMDPFQFRLLVHVDGGGQARLLQQAMVVALPAQIAADGTTNRAPRTVVLTDDARIRSLIQNAGDERLVARRVSTAVFGFESPIEMAFDDITTNLTCRVLMGYDDPLNPFKHKYHPDHDNLDERFEKLLPEGKESFDIQRDVTLHFTPTPPGVTSVLPGWQDTIWGGTYGETIAGVHKDTLYVEGVFQLTHVSPVGVLNGD